MDDRLQLRAAAVRHSSVNENLVGRLLPPVSLREVGVAVRRAAQPGEPEQPLLAVDGDFVIGHAGE